MARALPEYLLLELEQSQIEWAVVRHELLIARTTAEKVSRERPSSVVSRSLTVTQKCENLLARSSKDVRLGLYWAEAEAETRALSGIADGLWLMRQLWQRFRNSTLVEPESEGDLFRGIVAKLQVILLRVPVTADSEYTYTSVLNAPRDPVIARDIEAAVGRTPVDFYTNLDQELKRVESECFKFEAIVTEGGLEPVLTLVRKIQTTMTAWASALVSADDPCALRFWPEPTSRTPLAAQQHEPGIYLHMDGITGKEESFTRRGCWMHIDRYQHEVGHVSEKVAARGGVLTIHKRLDRASPAIQEACNRPRTIPRAILEVYIDDSRILLRAELEYVVIQEVQQLADPKTLGECLKLTYDRIVGFTTIIGRTARSKG